MVEKGRNCKLYFSFDFSGCKLARTWRERHEELEWANKWPPTVVARAALSFQLQLGITKDSSGQVAHCQPSQIFRAKESYFTWACLCRSNSHIKLASDCGRSEGWEWNVDGLAGKIQSKNRCRVLVLEQSEELKRACCQCEPILPSLGNLFLPSSPFNSHSSMKDAQSTSSFNPLALAPLGGLMQEQEQEQEQSKPQLKRTSKFARQHDERKPSIEHTGELHRCF